MSESSYRAILRTSTITGGAQFLNIAISLLKMKVLAVILGPAGVGLVGLYLLLIQTASSVAALGTSSVGTRQIAAAHADGGEYAVSRTRKALLWGTLALAITGAITFWLASGWIAKVIVAEESQADDVAWLALAVALTICAGSQAALLNGLRRIGDLAQINIGTAVIGTSLGITALLLWGAQGIVPMILITPMVTLILGCIYIARLNPPPKSPISPAILMREWRAMLPLGFAFMISGLVTTLGQLTVRALVQRDLGADALGQFQAAWAIGMTYLGFVLGAMGADYYPRLTGAIGTPATATRLVNEQTEVALLLCAPVLLAMLGLAPWIIHLLYSADFQPAGEILRWQLLGDLFKVMSWPLGFVILASRAGKTFMLAESISSALYVLIVLLLIPSLGVTATGVAFLALYLFYLPLVYWLGHKQIGFYWTRAVVYQAIAILLAALVVEVAARASDQLGAIFGASLAAAAACWAVMRLSVKAEADERFPQITQLGKQIRAWLIARR